MNPHLNPHLSEDELIALVYGLGDAEKKDERHLADCSECGERLKAMGQARMTTVDVPEISGLRLAAQRLQILERLEHPSSGLLAWRWVPVATAASLLAAAMLLHQQRPSVPQQAPPAPTAVNAEADAELFTDVYSMERDIEPKAAAPIRALFQETSFEEGHQ